jgi:hypothetical protein
MIDIKEAFNKYNDEYLQFDHVENQLNQRPDICAFLLIDKLLPNARKDIITCAEHDIFYLDVDCEKLAEVATEDDILTLSRCGVHYDSESDSLAMFA